MDETAKLIGYVVGLVAILLVMWAWSQHQHDECAASCPDRNGLMVRDAMGFPRCVCTPMDGRLAP